MGVALALLRPPLPPPTPRTSPSANWPATGGWFGQRAVAEPASGYAGGSRTLRSPPAPERENECMLSTALRRQAIVSVGTRRPRQRNSLSAQRFVQRVKRLAKPRQCVTSDLKAIRVAK